MNSETSLYHFAKQLICFIIPICDQKWNTEQTEIVNLKIKMVLLLETKFKLKKIEQPREHCNKTTNPKDIFVWENSSLRIFLF